MNALGVVVDVGGTRTRVALHRDGELVGCPHTFATPSPRSNPTRSLPELREELFDRIAAQVQRPRAVRGWPGGDTGSDTGSDVNGSAEGREDVGVAFGAVVSKAGVVRDASVLWLEASTGYDVAAALRRRLPWARPVVLNDVAAAAWHYRRFGRFALVTVSTGVAFKVFDAAAPPDRRVLLDPAGLGGESGHTVVEPSLVDADTSALGRAAAAGDVAARAELERRRLPWCECGAVADLCAYTSGPAVARAAAALARRSPEQFVRSALARESGADPERIDTAAIRAAATTGDGFTGSILRWGTRALAARLLQLCADLGLRTVVVVGGFAHGVGEPWFAALRRNLDELTVGAGWYAGWTDEERAALVHRPADAADASLAGMAAYLAARARHSRAVLKPVGEARLVVHLSEQPRCGREQFTVRPVFAGVCSTDLEILRGERGCEPGVLGHECVARVAEVGADVAGLRAGQLITLNPNNPRDDDDKIGHNRAGVFAEALVFDAGLCKRGQVVAVPGPARAEQALLEPLSAVVRSLDMAARSAPGRVVLVVGGGVAGLLHLLLAARRGARTLLASRSADHRERAVGLGLCAAADALPLDADLGRVVAERTAGVGVDTAVIAVGNAAGPEVTQMVWPALADGAALQLFGGFPARSRLPLAGGRAFGPVGPLRARAGSEMVTSPRGRKVVVMGNRGGRGVDLRAAVDLCNSGTGAGLALERLISHVVSLAALPGVAAELAESGTVRGEPALRVVIDFRLTGEVVRPVGATAVAAELRPHPTSGSRRTHRR